MTCNNCIHYEVCQHMYNVCLKMGINYFKDKSKYIELPCKIGNMEIKVEDGEVVIGRYLYGEI